MKISLKLARAGMNMEEATIVKWHKNPGDAVRADDVLYEIETEKSVVEITAQSNGTLLEIFVPEGEIAAVGQKICQIETSV